MTRIMKKTDIIVSRAGASTLSEIIALSIPSILIPSPYVPNNHQYKNAKDLIDEGAALLLEEQNLKDDILVKTIDKLIYDEKALLEMKKNLKKLDVPNSGEKIVTSIRKLIDRK